MSAPQNNSNAVKEDADRASSFLHIRCRPDEKAAWVRAASAHDKKLARWVTDVLNRETVNDR